MTLNKKARTSFSKEFREQFNDDTIVRMLYSKDIANYSFPLINTAPDAVISIKSEDQIIKAINLAKKAKVELIPRANATAPFGGALAYPNGVVLDLRGLEKEVYIEMFENAVICSANMRIDEVENLLNRNGVALRTYPLNYYSATIGGWIATGGWGLGNLQYGPPADNILSMEVITPEGKKKLIQDKNEIKLYFGSNGILGIITKVKLLIRFDSKITYYIASYDSPKDLFNALPSFFKLQPFAIKFFNPEQVKTFNKTFNYALPARFLLFLMKEIHYEEEEKEHYERFFAIVKETNGQIINKHYYRGIEKTRWRTIETARVTNKFSFSIVLLSISKGEKYLRFLQKIEGIRTIGVVISKDKILLLIIFPHLTERDDSHNKASRLQWKIVRKATKFGGAPYSTGLWYANSYKQIYGQEQYQQLLDYVNKYKSEARINTSKVFSPKVSYLPIKLKSYLKLISLLDFI